MMPENILILHKQSNVLHTVLGSPPVFLIQLDLRHSDNTEHLLRWCRKRFCSVWRKDVRVSWSPFKSGIITDVLRRQKGSREKTSSVYSKQRGEQRAQGLVWFSISPWEPCEVKWCAGFNECWGLVVLYHCPDTLLVLKMLTKHSIRILLVGLKVSMNYTYLRNFLVTPLNKNHLLSEFVFSNPH